MCGIVAYISKKDKNILNKAILSLKKLQHRGQDGWGICYLFKNSLKVFKKEGLIEDDSLSDFSDITIAHTRYSTKGDFNKNNLQPFVFKNVALCHNGTIFDFEEKKEILLQNGFSFESNSDSEVILKWLFYKLKNLENSSKEDILKILENDFSLNAYSIIILFKDKIMAFKDKNSYHPLSFFETKDCFILASENCAITEKPLKSFELSANSAIEINKKEYSYFKKSPKKTSQCVFEAVYFANSKSKIFNTKVKNKRIELGKFLAKNDDIKGDYVIPILNSGLWGAVGYSQESKIKLKFLIKNKENVLRTFIENKSTRKEKLEEKYIIDYEKIKGKKLVIVDDSIVRGSTSKKIIELLKKGNPKEIHLRLTSPMIINTCHWGVDIPNKNELIAYNLKSSDNIKKELEINSVKFIPVDSFQKMFNKNIWCHKCFLG